MVRKTKENVKKNINLEFKNTAQQLAWSVLEQHDVVFLVGPAGTAKTHLSVAYAVTEILAKRVKKIILTRPAVEAGEKLGFLPGTADLKVGPYLVPIFDCMGSILNIESKKHIDHAIEIAPLAYLRGRTFRDSICILDEAQNCKAEQIKMFLTRLGDNSKMIITGDPVQSDLSLHERSLIDIVNCMKTVKGIGVVEFNEDAIVRHPLVASILKAWPK